MTKPPPDPDSGELTEVIERALPPALLDSPLSRLGFWYATAVGWTWGFLWSTGRITRHTISDERLWVFHGMPPWTFRRGGTCVGACFLTDSRPVQPRVLRHESVHVRQWRRFGMLMPLLYLLAGRDPLTNRFEREAGLEDGNYVPRRPKATRSKPQPARDAR